jgi:hypothetical protein
MKKLDQAAVNLDDIRNPIDQKLRSVGFRSRSKRLWDRKAGRVIQVVHLDKSSYGPQNRLEVFFGLENSVNMPKYKIGEFDVKLNFERILKYAADFKSALDQETIGMAPDVRARIIQDALGQALDPILNLAIDEQGLRKLREILPNKNDFFIGPRTSAIIFPVETTG